MAAAAAGVATVTAAAAARVAVVAGNHSESPSITNSEDQIPPAIALNDRTSVGMARRPENVLKTKIPGIIPNTEIEQ